MLAFHPHERLSSFAVKANAALTVMLIQLLLLTLPALPVSATPALIVNNNGALSVNARPSLTAIAYPALVNDYAVILFMLIQHHSDTVNANPAFEEANPALAINANPDLGKA